MTLVWIGLALVAGLGVAAYFWGRTRARQQDAEGIARTKDAQLKVAADRPTSRDDLVRRVREKWF